MVKGVRERVREQGGAAPEWITIAREDPDELGTEHGLALLEWIDRLEGIEAELGTISAGVTEARDELETADDDERGELAVAIGRGLALLEGLRALVDGELETELNGIRSELERADVLGVMAA